MMTQPKTLKVTALILVCVALSFPIQVALLYGHMPWETVAIFAKLSNLNWIIMGFCILNASLIYRAAPTAKFTIPILMGAVGFNNGVVGTMADDYSLVVCFLGALAFSASHIGLFRADIFEIFINPDKRWWLTPKRRPMELPLMLSHSRNQSYIKSTTHDLSETGTFVSFLKAAEPLTQVKIDDSFFVCLNLGSLTQIRCQAKVVRVTDARGNYPAGVGLKFSQLARMDQRRIKRFLEAR